MFIDEQLGSVFRAQAPSNSVIVVHSFPEEIVGSRPGIGGLSLG